MSGKNHATLIGLPCSCLLIKAKLVHTAFLTGGGLPFLNHRALPFLSVFEPGSSLEPFIKVLKNGKTWWLPQAEEEMLYLKD